MITQEARSGRSAISLTSALCACVCRCEPWYVLYVSVQHYGQEKIFPRCTAVIGRQSDTRLDKPVDKPDLSPLSLLKCVIIYPSFNVYLGTYIRSQGCEVDICFLRLHDLCDYRKTNYLHILCEIIRPLFQSTLNPSWHTALELRIHMPAWHGRQICVLTAFFSSNSCKYRNDYCVCKAQKHKKIL